MLDPRVIVQAVLLGKLGNLTLLLLKNAQTIVDRLIIDGLAASRLVALSADRHKSGVLDPHTCRVTMLNAWVWNGRQTVLTVHCVLTLCIHLREDMD